MTLLRDVRELSVTEAARRGVAGLVAEAEQGADVVVTRHQRPIAAVINMSHLVELEELAEDLRDLALVLSRAVTDNGHRTSFDDVLAAFGYTRQSLDSVPDDE